MRGLHDRLRILGSASSEIRINLLLPRRVIFKKPVSDLRSDDGTQVLFCMADYQFIYVFFPMLILYDDHVSVHFRTRAATRCRRRSCGPPPAPSRRSRAPSRASDRRAAGTEIPGGAGGYSGTRRRRHLPGNGRREVSHLAPLQ